MADDYSRDEFMEECPCSEKRNLRQSSEPQDQVVGDNSAEGFGLEDVVPVVPKEQISKHRTENCAEPLRTPYGMPDATVVPQTSEEPQNRPRYDDSPVQVQPRPAAASEGHGWAIGLVCLLALAVFMTGAVTVSAQRRGILANLGQDSPNGFDRWDGPLEGPESLPNQPGIGQQKPEIGGNGPMDETGDTALTITGKSVDMLDPAVGEPLTIRQIADKAMPSVVGILAGAEDEYSVSAGSGVIMTSDGYVITNNHVVESRSGQIYADITVVLHNGDKYKAVQVRVDRNSDLAVLKIEAENLIPAEFGNSELLAVGDLAVAIGNPLGMDLQSTVTNGIISAINRDIVVEDIRMTTIQTNCAINPGNSGGPLINEYGQVVGIISSKIMSDYFSVVEGLGFAIPSNTVEPIVNELIARGYVKGRPAIGITGSTIDERTARAMGVPEGLRVVEINPNCDAYKQGLRVEDIITHLMDEPVTTVSEVNLIKNDYQVGESLTIKVYRPSEDRTFSITFKLEDSGALNG